MRNRAKKSRRALTRTPSAAGSRHAGAVEIEIAVRHRFWQCLNLKTERRSVTRSGVIGDDDLLRLIEPRSEIKALRRFSKS
jgi:hypothetical protein